MSVVQRKPRRSQGFGAALQSLAEMRQHEGAALGKILNSGRLDEIADLAARADAAPGRKADAIRQRLSEQIAVLMESGRFDQDRLYQGSLGCWRRKRTSGKNSIVSRRM